MIKIFYKIRSQIILSCVNCVQSEPVKMKNYGNKNELTDHVKTRDFN